MARRPQQHTSARPARSIRTRRALIGATVLGAIVIAGSAAASTNASSDPRANTVRPVDGAPTLGPRTGEELNANFVGLAAPRSGRGYWVAASDGGVFTHGKVRFFGSLGERPLTKPIVGIAARPRGDGYWLVGADGGVFTFGAARFHGSLGNKPLNAAITAIAATPSGRGYWLLGADGGVFRFGDARFYGSGAPLPNRPYFVSMAPTPSGQGYYLLAADGGVFTFGAARFSGAAIDGRLATAITVIRNGKYRIARSDGSIAGFGGAKSYGPPPDLLANQHPVIAIAGRRGGGAWVAHGYSPPPPPAPEPEPEVVDISQHPFLVCTRAYESDSAGGYRAISPGGTYRGAYQFLQSTWDSVARHAGRYDLVGVDPAAASPHDQDLMALHLYQWQGAAPWGGRCAGL
jgi:hypothetical protein